jgi:outer membrane receptor protein involved in Fe transport
MFDGPGINLSSLSIIRRISLGESRQIILRSDVRNVFNRAHFQLQSSTLQARADLPLGQVLSAAPGRNVQLSVRFSF